MKSIQNIMIANAERRNFSANANSARKFFKRKRESKIKKEIEISYEIRSNFHSSIR